MGFENLDIEEMVKRVGGLIKTTVLVQKRVR